MTRVNCSVKNCSYWGQGEVCNADTIWVKNNMGTRGASNSAFSQYTEFADDLQPDLGTNAKNQASGSHGTCCETMKPKEQGSGMGQASNANQASSVDQQQKSSHVHGSGCGHRQGK